MRAKFATKKTHSIDIYPRVLMFDLGWYNILFKNLPQLHMGAKMTQSEASSYQYSETVNMVQAAANLSKHVQNILFFQFASFGVLDELHGAFQSRCI
jgi:hypothetical protein